MAFIRLLYGSYISYWVFVPGLYIGTKYILYTNVFKIYFDYQDSVMMVKEGDWSTDLIQAQFFCVKGPDNNCLQAEFIDLTGKQPLMY